MTRRHKMGKEIIPQDIPPKCQREEQHWPWRNWFEQSEFEQFLRRFEEWKREFG